MQCRSRECGDSYLQGGSLRKLGQVGEQGREVRQLVGLLHKAAAQEGQFLGVGVVQLEEDEQLVPLNGVQRLAISRLL